MDVSVARLNTAWKLAIVIYYVINEMCDFNINYYFNDNC